MYEDIDWSSLLDFDGGAHFMSQQPEAMYVDDALDHVYSADSRQRLTVDELANVDDSYMPYYDRISISDLFDSCVLPTITQVFLSVSPVAGLCLVCRMSSIFCHLGRSSHWLVIFYHVCCTVHPSRLCTLLHMLFSMSITLVYINCIFT